MRNLILIVATISMLASCRVGPKYEKNNIEQSKASYSHASEKSDSLKLEEWFNVYKDPSLQKLVRKALDSFPDMRAAVARIEEARANAAIVKANLLPTIGYQLGAGTSNAGTNPQQAFIAQDRNYLNAAATLNWELDLFGRIRSSQSSFKNIYEQQIAAQKALMVSLIAEVADNYFLLLDLDNRIAIAQRTIDSRKESLRINAERFKKGYSAEIDELQAKMQLASVEATLPALKRQVVIVENNLHLLCGETGGTIERGSNIKQQSLPPSIPAGLPSQLLQRRPDVLAAEFALKAQYDRVGVAQANRFPVISLTGALGLASPQLSTLVSGNSTYASLGGGILGPIFAFNQNKRRVDVEKQKVAQLQAQYDKTVINALLDVETALAGNTFLAEEFEARNRQVEAARKALELSRQRYNFGYTSYLEVLIQENSLLDAEFQESVTLRQKHSAIVGLYKALGGGW